MGLVSAKETCAAVSCSITRMGPWQRGHSQVAGLFVEGAFVAGGGWWSRRRQSGNNCLRVRCQPAEVADTGEASGQHMEEEAAQELLRREGHGALLAAVRVVLPAEGDPGVGDREQAMVGDGDTMGVTREIVQHMLGSAEGRLGIDDPVLLEQ